MKITNEKLASAFEAQVTKELQAAMIYLQLSYALDDLGLTGMRDWMREHSAEELTHAAEFANHLLDRGHLPQIQNIEVPTLSIKTALDAFNAALEHERKVSASIRELARLAAEVGEFDARPLLDRFLDEQIEEEAVVGTVVDRIKMAGEDGAGILRIDSELRHAK